MKRLFKIAVAIIILSLTFGNVSAQNKVQLQTVGKGAIVEEAKKPKPQKPKKEKVHTEFSRVKGFYLRPEIGGGFYFGEKDYHSYIPGFGGMATLDFGYQITPRISAGIGIGYQFCKGSYSYNYYEYNSDNHTRNTKQSYKAINAVPLYADVRFYLSENECQPFFDLKLGYVFGASNPVVSVSRNFLSTGNPYLEGTGDTYLYGIWDSWNQYDEKAAMNGFYGSLSFGIAIRNFGIGIEADLLRWVYQSDKSYHKEIRPNGMPEWEYQQSISGRNEVRPILSSGEYAQFHGMVALKLEYNVPIIPKKKK